MDDSFSLIPDKFKTENNEKKRKYFRILRKVIKSPEFPDVERIPNISSVLSLLESLTDCVFTAQVLYFYCVFDLINEALPNETEAENSIIMINVRGTLEALTKDPNYPNLEGMKYIEQSINRINCIPGMNCSIETLMLICQIYRTRNANDEKDFTNQTFCNRRIYALLNLILEDPNYPNLPDINDYLKDIREITSQQISERKVILLCEELKELLAYDNQMNLVVLKNLKFLDYFESILVLPAEQRILVLTHLLGVVSSARYEVDVHDDPSIIPILEDAVSRLQIHGINLYKTPQEFLTKLPEVERRKRSEECFNFFELYSRRQKFPWEIKMRVVENILLLKGLNLILPLDLTEEELDNYLDCQSEFLTQRRSPVYDWHIQSIRENIEINIDEALEKLFGASEVTIQAIPNINRLKIPESYLQRRQINNVKILLAGPPGGGKTTIAEMLSSRNNFSWTKEPGNLARRVAKTGITSKMDLIGRPQQPDDLDALVNEAEAIQHEAPNETNYDDSSDAMVYLSTMPRKSHTTSQNEVIEREELDQSVFYNARILSGGFSHLTGMTSSKLGLLRINKYVNFLVAEKSDCTEANILILCLTSPGKTLERKAQSKYVKRGFLENLFKCYLELIYDIEHNEIPLAVLCLNCDLNSVEENYALIQDAVSQLISLSNPNPQSKTTDEDYDHFLDFIF